ncbi:outer membrane protein assembly factor BamC [Rhodoferax sp.]|uniref:outer membrane protein assembly factor BamC n=1 Tax=Rhodoferax sp. TaxID=50421 RepID=UPI003783189D
MNTILKALALVAVLVLGGCSSLQPDKVDYRSAVRSSGLEVPPDLTQLSKDTRYAIVEGAVSAAGSKVAQSAVTPPAVAASTLGDVRIERSGNQRWLVVKRSPEQLWPGVREFWKDNGFVLTLDQSNIGIMETDWAENRAKIPQDFLRATLGKVLDNLYSTAERDKFRTRLEATTDGHTEIYISHRGLLEVDASGRPGTVWRPRASDPELEAEFLRRLMVRLGATAEQAQAQVAASLAKPTSQMVVVGGQSVLRIPEGFDAAWRRVGLTLDRTGFTVEDRDRKQGVYFVRYVAANVATEEPGFLGRLFSSKSKQSDAVKYQISVRSQADSSTVTVLDAAGGPVKSESAQKIMEVIAQDLR